MLTTPVRIEPKDAVKKEVDDDKNDCPKTPPKTKPEKALLTRTPTPFKNAMAEVGKRRSGS